jgi:hypothetical protein
MAGGELNEYGVFDSTRFDEKEGGGQLTLARKTEALPSPLNLMRSTRCEETFC